MAPLKRLWRDLVRWLGLARELTIEEKQLELLNLAIVLERGDPTRASALLFSVGARGSMRCLIDPMDLFDMSQEHVAAHLHWLDRRRGRK